MTSRLALGLLLAAALAGCGKMGALERPGPVFGEARGPATADDEQTGKIETLDPRDRRDDPAPGAEPDAPKP
jgi:hypothetical protein